MPNKRTRGWAGWSLITLSFLLLVGCGGGQVTQHSSSPTKPGASPTAPLAPKSTPGITRVPYPWPMAQSTTSFGTNTWKPANPAVDEEMQQDFLSFWAWSGHQQPSVVLHFTPDVSQIPRFATTAYAGQLQAYVQQVQSSGQVVTYLGQHLVQAISDCTQDGLQCTTQYALGVTVKTVLSTKDGTVLSETTASNFFVSVHLGQVYNQELQLWQVGSLNIDEFSL